MHFDRGAVRRWLDDIHCHIIVAQNYADGLIYDAFCDDPRTANALVLSDRMVGHTAALTVTAGEAQPSTPPGVALRRPGGVFSSRWLADPRDVARD